jgi:hypothetical protein
VFPVKGEYTLVDLLDDMLTRSRFGWVNASYIYGLQMLPNHMRRAMGALTTWDRFEKATEELGL